MKDLDALFQSEAVHSSAYSQSMRDVVDRSRDKVRHSEKVDTRGSVSR